MSIRIKCKCGKILSARDEYAGRRARCPKCKASFILPATAARTVAAPPVTSHGPGQPSPQPAPAPAEVMRANRRLAGKACPVCHTTINLGEELHNCLECGQPHHLSCWDENNGCGSYGCPNGPSSQGTDGDTDLVPAAPEVTASAPTATTAPHSSVRRGHVRRRWPIALAVAVVVAAIPLTIFALNHSQVQSHLNNVVGGDPRNGGIVVSTHYAGWVNADVLTFDLKKVPGDKSPADIFRVFLQFAHRMRDKHFDKVQLCFRGKVKFLLPGSDFRELGNQYSWQNPAYLVRTFPEKLKNPDGSRAFPAWSGGVLGVAMRQMKDFNEFHRRWYISDIVPEL